MSDTVEIMPCLVLPTDGKSLLLPNVAVAEIVDYQTPTVTKKSLPGFLGTMLWRGMTIPLLSYAQVNGQAAATATVTPRVAVLNTVGEKNKSLPFIALATTGIPRLLKVASNAIEEQDSVCGPAAERSVRLDDNDMEIPNLEYLEAFAAKAMNL